MDGLRIAMRPSVKYYTPEGDFIEQEFVDGYSSARIEFFSERDVANARARGRDLPRAIIEQRSLENA
ncbi:MAG: hypothetical protein Q8J76_06765 [Desulfobulbaceae bacterium]|nr:hypothetical protein [Desulfobulbaceae bacterium]